MSLNQFKDNECLLLSQKHCPCIEFILGEHDRHGFHAGQLLHYRLEANDDAGPNAPREKLTLAFATADVTLTGRRLDRIADSLHDGELLAVRALPARYAGIDNAKVTVASITIDPIIRA